MNKLISSLAVSCLVVLSIAPAKAQLVTGIVTSTKTGVANTVTNTTNSNAAAQIYQGATAKALETTNTGVGNSAGASTASITNVTADPSKTQLYSPTQIVQPTGNATVGVTNNQQSTQADAKANLGVTVANSVTVSTCLGGSVSVGSLTQGSSTNCSNSSNSSNSSAKPKKVPEPGTMGGVALMGAYFIYRRQGKASLSKQFKKGVGYGGASALRSQYCRRVSLRRYLALGFPPL